LGNAAVSATSAVNLAGQPNINIAATTQDLSYQLVSAKTNLVHALTNDVTVEKSTTTNSTINATSLLVLLANSFNTNFPAGTQLLLVGARGSYQFAISDSTGTNIAPLGVYQVMLGQPLSVIHSGTETELTTNQLISSGNDTESFTSALE